MVCPNCGAEVADPDAIFCSRCGAAFSPDEAEATEKIAADDVAEATTTSEVDASPTVGGAAPSTTPLLAEYAAAVRTRFVTSWLDPMGAACLAFLVLLLIGAVLLVAAKLQFSGFGAGANPIEILSAIAILGLAILRVPVHVDDLVVSVLPLGALAAAGLGIAWATSVTLRDGYERRVLVGASVGIPFALICWIAALVFRFEGRNEVFAGAWGALVWGLIWGAVFGAVGAVRGPRPWAKLWAWIGSASKSGAVHRGVAAAGVAGAATAVLGGIAMLLWVIVGLVTGAPGPRFGFGDAVAAFVYLVAFGPNVVVTLTALGMGVPVYVGARVTVAGGAVGNIDRIWLFGEAPGYVALLILIPLIACSLGGFWARRVSEGDELPTVIGVYALAFATGLALLAWLGEARLGAALLGRGLARLDVNAPVMFLLGLVWAALAGLGGWSLANRAKGGSR